MPEGPLGAPRLQNLGPLTRPTQSELESKWESCPDTGKPAKICETIKFHSIIVLESQGFFVNCNSLAEINSGKCTRIAETVTGEIDDLTVLQAGYGDHVWVEYNGRHYDAEAPTGVDEAFDLPFFARISPKAVLDFMKMEAQNIGDEVPQTEEDIISDVTDKYY